MIEAILRDMRESLQSVSQSPARFETKRQLARAAELLTADYEQDKELTAFTALDGEDFHA